MTVNVVILAAGKGTRMNSELPKVLHPLGGRPIIEHVIDAANRLPEPKLYVVVGHGAEMVKAHFGENSGINWVSQHEQLGTGHAVDQAMPQIGEDAVSSVLVLCGDVPMIKPETLEDLTRHSNDHTVSLLTLETTNPKGLGRIIRDDEEKVIAIVEEKDASEAQLRITEINSGIMVLPTVKLRDWLSRLGNDNEQGEFYLTDVIAMAVNDGCRIHAKKIFDENEVQGINDKAQLATLERHYQMAKNIELMAGGVTMLDPSRVDIRGKLSCGKDVSIDINTVFEGDVHLGDNVSIGPNVTIKDAEIGDNTVVLANCVIEDAEVANDCNIGPFARLRPGAKLLEKARVGNFVEIKNSTLGVGSKVNHFAYIGDATLGAGVNVGAGTIFCNYDGAHKHHCEIGNNVFIGSNSTLVAPLSIADGAFIAAGSTINSNVSEEELAIGRGKQRNISGWKRPVKNG